MYYLTAYGSLNDVNYLVKTITTAYSNPESKFVCGTTLSAVLSTICCLTNFGLSSNVDKKK